MDRHVFTTEEYCNLIENIRRQGVAEGMAMAKREMGESLDLIADSMNFMPYRFPVWRRDHIAGMGAAQPIECPRPGHVELTKDQLEAIRMWLCGPRP